MRKSVLYVGQAYYNHWYISREIRKLGWKADLVDINTHVSEKDFFHGHDFSFSEKGRDTPYLRFRFLLNAIADYNVFHFANANGMYIIQDFDGKNEKPPGIFRKLAYSIVKGVLSGLCGWKSERIFTITRNFGVKNSFRILKLIAPCLPERWDVRLLKKCGKKIVYTNNGCLDGVLPSSFAKWTTPDNIPVCDICAHKHKPEVCSEQKNRAWGEFRNEMADYQCLLGGNKADFNLSEKVHEVPEVYALDTQFWSPDQLLPSNYLLPIPADTIKLFHAVGNFESRSNSTKTIKSTHIYFPLVEKMKQSGLKVEIIFFKDVPNKKIKYYQAQADIFIDMLTFGFFGATIREGLMLGKPCVCYLRPEWIESMRKEVPEYAEELPVISAHPGNIEEVLTDLIRNPQKRAEIGKRSREFAVKWHSGEAGARRMNEIYTALLQKNN